MIAAALSRRVLVVRIATWNVNSVRARLPRLLPWLKERRPDVVCLQELKCVDEAFPREPLEELGYNVETFGQKTYNGVALLSREPIAGVVKGLPGDPEGLERRVIGGTIGRLQVLNVYVVNGQEVGCEKYDDKLAWLDRLRAYIAGDFDLAQPFLLAGDFNVTFDDRDVHDPEAWRERILCSTPERAALARVMDLGLCDAFRAFHQEGGHYTWWDFRTFGFKNNQGLRLDHVLLSPSALAACTGVEIDLEARGGQKPSDHAPVLAAFSGL